MQPNRPSAAPTAAQLAARAWMMAGLSSAYVLGSPVLSELRIGHTGGRWPEPPRTTWEAGRGPTAEVYLGPPQENFSLRACRFARGRGR